MWFLFVIFCITVIDTTARALRDFGNPPVERLSTNVVRGTRAIPAPAPTHNWRDYYVRP